MKFKTNRESKPPPPLPPFNDHPPQQQHERNSALKVFKQTMKEVANPRVSRFNHWDEVSLKSLLVENNVQIRGSANASHSTLVRICDEVFGQFDNDDVCEGEQSHLNGNDLKSGSGGNSCGGSSLNFRPSFTFEDLAHMNLAAIKIQKMFIASRKRMYENMFSQGDQHHYEYDQEYYDEQDHQQQYEEYYDNDHHDHQDHVNQYYNQADNHNQELENYEEYQVSEAVQLSTADQLEGGGYCYDDEHLEPSEEYSNVNNNQSDIISDKGNDHYIDDEADESMSYDHNSLRQQSQNEQVEEEEREDVDELDEELQVEWRKPSWKFAKKFEAENRPHKAGKFMKKYDWRRDTLGRHCMMGGCGEQLDLWNEGATSEFSQFGSGITNYFKFIKWCSWIMLILSIIHVPAIIINILADSSGTQYESPLAKTTLGNLGNAKDVEYIQISGCNEDAYHFNACRWKKNHVALLYSFIDVTGTAIVILGWVWLRTFEKKEVDHLNRCTVDASDYTVRVRGISSKTKERELAAHFANITDSAVAEVSLAYNNSKAIQFYKARGKIMKDRIDCVQRIRYAKSTLRTSKPSTKQVNRKIRKLLLERRRLTAQIVMKDEERKQHVASKPQAIQAFVTFETEQGFLKAISSYQVHLFRQFLCYPKRLLFKEARLKLSQAPEPSTIMWENLEITSTSRFCRKCFTTFVASLAVLMSIYFTFLAKAFREDLVKQTDKDCPDYVHSLSIEELNAVVKQNSDLSHCYCPKLDPQEQWNEDVCVDYMKGALKASAMNYGASFMVVFMNMFFTILMDMAGSFEKHESLDSMQSSNMTRLFLLKFVNTGCLILMYNVTLIQAIVGVRFDDPQNFNIDWFETGGVSMIIVMCINIISPHIASLIQYRSHTKNIRNLETKGLTKEKETNDRYKIWYTQEELNAVYLGPQFRLNYRYTQCLVNFFICWMYSISMPVLPFIGAVSFYLSYWVDKFLFCNFYRVPPKYSDSIGSNSSSLIGYGIMLHIAMSCWILGSNQIFMGQNIFKNSSFTYRWTHAMFKMHIIPLEVLGIVFVVGLFMRHSLVTFTSTFTKFLLCLTCSNGDMRRLTKTMNTVQVDYGAARARGVIKGLASYNILQNPKYQEAFAISSDFASSHSRLNSIRGYNTKEGGLCISESSRDNEDTSSNQV